MPQTPQQLGLAISLREETRFSNFVVQDERNSEVLAYLASLAPGFERVGREFTASYLWGSLGSGLSHLLQAVCHQFIEYKLQAQYLPVSTLLDYSSDAVFESLEFSDLVCIDDIDQCVGHYAWQRSLFSLFNALKDHDKCFICAAHSSPTELLIELPDLRSRLLSGAAFQVAPLDDVGLECAFQQRAAERGLEITDDVIRFIFLRIPRSANTVFRLLDQLDALSLREKRKITVPFVRQVLDLGDKL